MAATDEDALRCDFAQVYHILDFRRLPLRTAAVFAQGLPGDSRIMRKLSGARYGVDTALLAQIADAAALLVWMRSKDGQRGVNRPRSVFDLLFGNAEKEAPQHFSSPAEFMAAWQSLAGGEKLNGN